MNPLNSFMKSAVGLTKNPLGIIGLFISLIYGFACLVLSTSIANLNSANERLPLIWFIIAFPIAILGAFIYLVVNHHEKLYAPSDFRNDDAFIETLSGKKIKEKQEKEIKILNSANESDNKTIQTKTTTEIKTTKPKLVEPVENKIDLKEDITNRVSNAEKWAVKDLELKYKTIFKTNQRLLANNTQIDLDAYSSNPNKITIVEVKYWESNKAIKPLLISLQDYILKLDKFKILFKKKEVELIIVLVFDKIQKENILKIENFLTDFNENIKLEVKDYFELLDEYRE